MKKKTIKSALPIYGVAILWLLLGIICPRMLLKGGFLAGAAVVSVLAYLGLSKVFKGREIEVREAANSGDAAIDRMIEEGRKQLDSLKAINAALPAPDITANLNRMTEAGESIFRILEKDTSKAESVRRFMNYYLPTAEKLMNSYRMLVEENAKGADIEHAMKSIENSLSMIAAAFEKQNENLFKNRAIDIETDIDVLENLMAGDGLIGKGSFKDVAKPKKEAASVPKTGSTPVLTLDPMGTAAAAAVQEEEK